MLVKDKKHFYIGIVMAISFLALFLVIMSPVFNGMNGLEFADDTFNRLSKGSANFHDKVFKKNESFVGKPFSAKIKYDSAEDAQRIAGLLHKANIKVSLEDTSLNIEGDLGNFLNAPIRDADSMYKNDDASLVAMYGYEGKLVLKDWWIALNKINKDLQAQKDFVNASMVLEVSKKLIETSYNYFSIEAKKVQDGKLLMTFLLVFYVFYTLWWGFALYHIFEGVGLTAKKAKVKKEV